MAYSKLTPDPAPSTITPPPVADSGATGTMEGIYAIANHTHESRVRKARVTTAVDGTILWNFAPPFEAGVVPIVVACAEAVNGSTDVINAHLDGAPTNTQARLRITRTNRSAVALLGLTILSVPSSPGATVVHAAALAP